MPIGLKAISMNAIGLKGIYYGTVFPASYKYRNFTIGLHDLQAVGAEEISAEYSGRKTFRAIPRCN